MIIRISDPYEDADNLMRAAVDRVSSMGDLIKYFPKDMSDFTDAMSRLFLADYIDIIVAEHEGKPVGGVGMAYLHHIWNPKLLNAEEVFLWIASDAPKTTGMRLLKFAKRHSKKRGADVITFRKLVSNPDMLASVYKRMGLEEIEIAYSGLL